MPEQTTIEYLCGNCGSINEFIVSLGTPAPESQNPDSRAFAEPGEGPQILKRPIVCTTCGSDFDRIDEEYVIEMALNEQED